MLLLKNIPALPKTITDCDNWYIWDSAFTEINEYIPKNISKRCRSVSPNDLGYLTKFTHKIDCINCIDNDTYAVLIHMCSRKELMKSAVRGEKYPENTIGIYINEEAGTHFIEEDFPNIRRMPAAERNLKQTPSHFLRIFKCNANHVLYVWTNKALQPETIYKLKQLQNAIDNNYLKKPKTYVTDFYKALVNNDIEALNKALKEFEESDYVKEYAIRIFQECMTYNITNKITKLENDLEYFRSSIQQYESEIMEATAKIRENNEQIEYLKNKDQKEDIKLLYRYLQKHPYIKHFKPNNNGTLEFQYNAPLLYFNEYALDKLIKNRTGKAKEILEIIKSKKYTLWTRCALQLNTETFRVYIIDSEKNEFFPHPHIERYHCFGNHNQAISESALSGDYIGAIEQMSQAVLNINFYDTCVVNRMIEDLESYANSKTWIKEETGELISLNEIREENTL